tara:strand:- start:21807 stop:22538 length:732 start_codon:yes stop_codon:yes gene_type:complete
MMSKLPILATLFGAYAEVLKNLGVLVRAALLPALLMLILSVVTNALGSGFLSSVVFWFVSLPSATLIAMSCHRVVLLGPDSLNNPWSLYWTDRETEFFINLIILSGMMFLAKTAFGVIFLMAPETAFGMAVPWLGIALTYIVVTYVQGRFSMVLPANAVGKKMFLSASWYLTAGNGPRIAVVLLMPIFILAGVTIAFSQLESDVSLLGVVGIGILYVLTFLVEIAALSLSYKFLQASASSTNA